MAGERISAGKVLAQSFSVLGREKKLAAGLVVGLAAIMAALMWPFIPVYVELFSSLAAGTQPNPAGIENMSGYSGYVFLLMPLYFVVWFATMVLWSRASVRGTKVAFEGGVSALFRRLFKAFWRYICTVGWMILVMAGFMIAVFLIVLLVGLAAGTFGFSQETSGLFGVVIMLVYLVLYIPMLWGFSALLVLFNISLYGEANDFRLPIHESFSAMDGNLMRASGVFFLVLIGYYIVYLAGFLGVVAVGFAASPAVAVIALFVVSAVAALFYFFSITYGAIYASLVVPELVNLDFKRKVLEVF